MLEEKKALNAARRKERQLEKARKESEAMQLSGADTAKSNLVASTNTNITD